MNVNDNTEFVLNDIHRERVKQAAKWGDQTHDIFTDRRVEAERARHRIAAETCKLMFSAVENPGWDLILLEEVYEAFSEEDPHKIREELVQVAAVACAIIEDLDKKHGWQRSL